ncbi:hypothetical protein [Microbacterium suwonense]|uniref:Uncharacterized protein n=1 Tax=Microbacterium suwonense TaxID=683047 RepID=A0ABM8FRZ2_9MICO|nr:hypothetical protein [Microbacterium suwonense]BDZ38450.1 hypothetical protein GCM10025863_10640 [Microbacterium suwonense]
MSTEALLRQTTHPPCTEEHDILEITVPADRTELGLADRLSLRIGLWLLLRAQRNPRHARAGTGDDIVRHRDRTRVTEHDAITLLAHGLQRHLR